MGKSGKPPVKITRVETSVPPPARPPEPPPEPPSEPQRPVQAEPGERKQPRQPPVSIISTINSANPPAPAVTPEQPKKVAPKAVIDALTSVYRAGRHADALEAAQAMTRQFPDTMAGWNITGAAARALGKIDVALESFAKLEALRPDFAGAPYNLGLVYEDRGELDAAAQAYRRAIAADPSLAQAHNNLGTLLTGQRRLDEAIPHLEKACALRPDMAEVHNSLGNALKQAERYSEAAAAYQQSLKVQPGFTKALYNFGVLEQERGDPARAERAFRIVLEKEPGHALACSHLVHQLAQLCDWDGLAEFKHAIADLGVTGAGVPPWPLLAVEDHPERQLARARNWAKRRFDAAPTPMPAAPKTRPQRLKICYFSGDFYDHPSMHLMAGMLAAHDRERFEVHAFSYGEQPDDSYRRKARECIEHFHDIARQSDQAIIDKARAIGFDIVIDRKGYSAGTRNQILQARLAPVQVNYLAYPGTLGADFIDYIVADPVVIPDHQRAAVSEKLIRLPYCYQATDDSRPIAAVTTQRADFGLPEDAFVLCSFNASYKITPAEFDIWMRVMKQVEGSVLWLLSANSAVISNLRAQAERRGVDGSRLIFAERLPNPEHLARHVHADLFLDSFAVNAHTTANDALWSGLPLVTMQGEQFAARVASSLLQSVGLPELVTHSATGYETLILELARSPARLAEIRAKLAVNRTAMPLFNTALYTRHFEAGLSAAYDRWFEGKPPADITVSV